MGKNLGDGPDAPARMRRKGRPVNVFVNKIS